ncbi:solute carrier family 15 member 2-like isoform X2 [Amblyomma americanum]
MEPEATKPYPKAVFFIIGNEFCERFSYYGMRTILTLFLINVLMFEEHTAKSVYHGFVMACYFSPVLGAMIADSYLGKFRTIFYISIVYAVGNITLAVSAVPALVTHTWIPMIGLAIIAFGTGGIKPCVSAFGGDQFLPGQERQLEQFFSLFYLSINAGSLLSTFITPILRVQRCLGQMFCFPLAFGVPAALMVLALVLFVIGKPLYRIVPPAGNVVIRVLQCIWHALSRKVRSKESRAHWLDHADDVFEKSLIADIKDVLHVLVLYAPLPVFWALFDQQGSQWTLQANKMDGEILGYQVLPDQMQLVNPLLILVLVPVFSYVVYPLFGRCNLLNRPLQKITVGGLAAAAAFAVAGCLDLALESSAEAPVPAGFSRVAFVNTLPCPVDVSGNELRLRLESGEVLSVPELPRAALQASAAAPCELSVARLEATAFSEAQSHSIFFLEDKQMLLAALVANTRGSNSHNAEVRVAYTVREPVSAVVFADASGSKTYAAAPTHIGATSSYTNATGLTPGRYTARLLGSDDYEVAACEASLKNGGHYTVTFTQQADGGPLSSKSWRRGGSVSSAKKKCRNTSASSTRWAASRRLLAPWMAVIFRYPRHNSMLRTTTIIKGELQRARDPAAEQPVHVLPGSPVRAHHSRRGHVFRDGARVLLFAGAELHEVGAPGRLAADRGRGQPHRGHRRRGEVLPRRVVRIVHVQRLDDLGHGGVWHHGLLLQVHRAGHRAAAYRRETGAGLGG